jgi:hypothetical protein
MQVRYRNAPTNYCCGNVRFCKSRKEISSIDEPFKIELTIFNAVVYKLLRDFLCSYIFSQSNLLSIISGMLRSRNILYVIIKVFFILGIEYITSSERPS